MINLDIIEWYQAYKSVDECCQFIFKLSTNNNQ